MKATQAATAEATATAAMIDATGRTMGRGAKNITDRRYSSHRPPIAGPESTVPKTILESLSMVEGKVWRNIDDLLKWADALSILPSKRRTVRPASRPARLL